MTPSQKLKWAIISAVQGEDDAEVQTNVTAENVDSIYERLVDEDGQWDAMNELRCGQVETGLPCTWSRHYESKSVAAQMPDGSWVGWTYWYGGGKHGEPAAIDWIEEAYAVGCKEEEKLVVARTFTRIESNT